MRMRFNRLLKSGMMAAVLPALAACVPATGERGARPAAPPVEATLPVVKPVAPGSSAITHNSDFILVGEARQGGAMRGTVPAGTQRLLFNGAQIPVDKDGQFLIAFDRDAGETATLEAKLRGRAAVERVLTVTPGTWRLEHINAPYTGRATSEEFQRLRAGELQQIVAAREVHSGSGGWRQSFRWPVTGRISGLFGAQRVYQGKPGSYHGGIDIAVPTGTAFVAPADGVVVLAADKPFTLEGHLLIIDHGMGLNSAFLHCASLFVKEGDVVRQGQTLGTVGSSGRATGPHMHWGLKWNDSRLDPLILAGPMPKN